MILALIILAAGTIMPLGEKAPPKAETAAEEAPVSKSTEPEESFEFDEAPQPIKQAKIRYPAEAREAGAQGRVMLMLKVLLDGSVEVLKVLEEVEEYPILTEAAIEGVSKWLFKPGSKDGKPVLSTICIPIEFKIHD
jgi:TonB family protein